MKKAKVLIVSLICILTIVVCGFLAWDLVLYEILPWTKTEFASHQSYIELVKENRCFGGRNFQQNISNESGDTAYYWHRSWSLKEAVYSTIQEKTEYGKMIENRMKFYGEEWVDWKNVQVYMLEEDKYCHVDESEWFSKDLSFVKKVMKNPDARQEYYFLTAVKMDTADGFRYSGVILNKNTTEMIEFSFELADTLEPRVDAWTLQEF